jgi:D-alanyl-D-alanine carboxypeptidase (penicillin-binding protein 5/6)
LGAQTSNDRFAEAKKLLDYGFFNYENYSIAVKDEPLEPISVIKGQKEKVNVQIKEDVSVLIKKGEQSKVKKEIQTESKLNAPINKGDKVGEVKYYIDDQLIYTADIVTSEEVQKITFPFSLKNLFLYAFMAK